MSRREISWIPVILAVVVVASMVQACGGGGGGGAHLELLGVVAEGIGDLPTFGVFLNNPIRMEFSLTIDPESVSQETVRFLAWPDLTEAAPGRFAVDGRHVTFFPDLPQSPDLSEAGFLPNTLYRLHVRGYPDLHTVRSRSGKPLAEPYINDFTTRTQEPFFLDVVAGPPFVEAVLIDLDGDGVLEGDGDPATPEAEEFPLAEHDFGPIDPFTDGVPPGAAGRTEGHLPLRVGILFSEPLHPATVYEDGAFDSYDLDTLVPCPGNDEGCPRPVRFLLGFHQQFEPATNRYRTLATLEYEYALHGLSRHLIHSSEILEDLARNPMGNGFDAVFRTTESFAGPDCIEEDFESRRRRDDATSAIWNVEPTGVLKAALGIGGDGSDGKLVNTGDTVVTLNTNDNGGIFNFSSWELARPPTSGLRIVGKNPAVIRVLGDVVPPAPFTITSVGEPGEFGLCGDSGSIEGGRSGCGGGDGGAANSLGRATTNGDAGESPAGFHASGGEGGISAFWPGGGGGGGHANAGSEGEDGEPDTAGVGGRGFGESFLHALAGGAGGGGGGNAMHEFENAIRWSGGGGGGGGGAILIESARRIVIGSYNYLNVNGGGGGSGSLDPTLSGGGGGGGAGGAVILRAVSATGTGARIYAKGGPGGLTSFQGGSGGAGSDGVILLEDHDGYIPGFTCDPPAQRGAIQPGTLGHSFGQSDFLPTNLPPDRAIRWEFSGSDPDSGEVRCDSEDLWLVDEFGNRIFELPDGVHGIWVVFRGALEDPARPDEPDSESITSWTLDISNLDGYPLLQWRILFDVDFDASYPYEIAYIAVDQIVIRFRME